MERRNYRVNGHWLRLGGSMLLELAVRDFAIIDEVRIAFVPGLNALTGETGAGKSILIDALGAVLGGRVGADVVRTGATRAQIEATFDVSTDNRPDFAAVLVDAGVEPEDGLLILQREVQASGRSLARINGRMATASTLARIGASLVDIHGQSDHLSLLRPTAQLEVLDRYAGTTRDRQQLAGLVGDLRLLRARIAEIVEHAREREQRADLLRFQVDEIAAAALVVGEDEALAAERLVLANAERLATDAGAAHDLLAGHETDDGALPALEALRKAAQFASDIAAVDESAVAVSERLNEALYLVQDVTAELRDYRDRIEADPVRLATIEERLDELRRLQRKYGATIPEVTAFGDRAARELEELTGGDSDVEQLRERASMLARQIGERASALSQARSVAGRRLSRAVETTIAEMNMGRSRFEVQVSQRDDPEGVPTVAADGTTRTVAVDASGADEVLFLIAPNAGEALKPLARVASGGETARLMLALKSILSEADETPTLVFDEVDVGVGGRSGQVVGEKLWGLARAHQVLVISHLAQIAAFAEQHLRIAKGESGGRVVSHVEPISGDDRLWELAAMLDGQPPTPASLRNAEAMVERVEQWKHDHAPISGATGG